MITEKMISKRQREVLELISQEYSNKEIAIKLNIKVGTVETHRKILFDKFGARNMAGLMRKAYDAKVLIPRYTTDTKSKRASSWGNVFASPRHY